MSLCPSCRCVIKWICGVTAGRRAWPCLDSRVSERKRYPSDLTDERWALIEPVITAWKAAHRSVSGHQGGYEMREIVNAILYQSRTGCQWDYLPHDLPPRSAAYYYFALWRDDGTDQAIHDLLRWHVREKTGRKADPSLVVLDTQSVHAAASVPAATTGKDAGKKVPGRKRGLAVDVLGLVIAVVVLAAIGAREHRRDRPAGPGGRAHHHGAQGAGRSGLQEHGRRPRRDLGIDVEIVERNPAARASSRSRSAGWSSRRSASCTSPAAGPRLRAPARQFRVARLLGDDRRHGPTADRHVRAIVAARVTAAPDPGRLLLDKIDAREQALTREAGEAQALIDELTAKVRELSEAINDLQVTRKTLISLAGPRTIAEPAGEPAGLSPALPDHPAYQQILTAFADRRRPLRARDLCVALDLPIVPKNTENIRSKLKRLANRGILVQTEPGLFAQPRP